MLSFVKYWEKNIKFIDNKKFIEDEVKLKKHKTDNDYACVICGKGADNSEKRNQLKIFAEDVSDSSKTLVASTENLFMPLIQFAFLFPILMLWISKACNINVSIDHNNMTNDGIDFESMKDFFHRKEVLCEPQVCELITKSETRNWKILKTPCLVIMQ